MIYPMDSTIQPLNNWGLINKLDRAQSYLARFITDLPPEIPRDICSYPIDPRARAGIVSKVY